MWPLSLHISKDECRGILRRLELEAYGGLLNAFRAQGTLGQKKRDMLNQIRFMLHISHDRHKAEMRRVINDETLSTVSERIYGNNNRIDWLIEGRRTVPLIPRGKLNTAYTTLADNLAKEALEEDMESKSKPRSHMVQQKKELTEHTNIVTVENKQVLPPVPRERTKKRRRESVEDNASESKQLVQTQNSANSRIPQTIPQPTKSTTAPNLSKNVTVKDKIRKKSSQLTSNAKIKQLYNSQNKVKGHSSKKSSSNVLLPSAPKIKTNRVLNPQPKGVPPSKAHVRKVFEPGPVLIAPKVDESSLSPIEQVSISDSKVIQSTPVIQTPTTDKVQYVVSGYPKVAAKPQEDTKNIKTSKPVLVQNITNIKQYPNLTNGKTLKLVSLTLPNNKLKPLTSTNSTVGSKVTITNSSYKPISVANKSNIVYLQKPKPITVTKDGKEIKLITTTKKEHIKPVLVLDVATTAQAPADKSAAYAQILQASGIIPTNNKTNNIDINKPLYVNCNNKKHYENNVNTFNSTDWEEELDNATNNSNNKYAISNLNSTNKVKVLGYKINNGNQVLRIDDSKLPAQTHHETIVCINPKDTFTIIKDNNDTVMSDCELMGILNGNNAEIVNSDIVNTKHQDIFQKALEQADIKLGDEYLDDTIEENMDKIYVSERLQGDMCLSDHIVYEPIQRHEDNIDIIVKDEIVVENYYVEQNLMNVDDDPKTFNIGTTDVEMSLMEVT